MDEKLIKDTYLKLQKVLTAKGALKLPKTKMPFLNENSPVISNEINIRIEDISVVNDIFPSDYCLLISTSGKHLVLTTVFSYKEKNEKYDIAKNLDISTLYILTDKNKLTNQSIKSLESLENNLHNINWLYNSKVEKIRKALSKIANKRYIICRDNQRRVYGCPLIKKFNITNKYADIYENCSYCSYILACNDNYILCTGDSEVSTYEQLKRIAPEI